MFRKKITGVPHTARGSRIATLYSASLLHWSSLCREIRIKELLMVFADSGCFCRLMQIRQSLAACVWCLLLNCTADKEDQARPPKELLLNNFPHILITFLLLLGGGLEELLIIKMEVSQHKPVTAVFWRQRQTDNLLKSKLQNMCACEREREREMLFKFILE